MKVSKLNRGFSFMEMIVVMIIVGILTAIVLENYGNSVWQSRVQGVENNLRAIAAAQQKYNEENGNYYTTANSQNNDFSGINSNLSLTMANVNDGFTYSCAGLGVCTASTSLTPPTNLPDTVTVDANGDITCSNTGTSTICP